MKTYVLTVSKTFPVYHPKKGLPTGFEEKIISGSKLHTIRTNYNFWEKRIIEINKGNACLSIRHWTGKPYNSRQQEIGKLYEGEVGIQRLSTEYDLLHIIGNWEIDYEYKPVSTHNLAENDGLDFIDFVNWFKPVPKMPLAIIHFTDFRY